MDHKQAERQVISNMVVTTLYGLNIYCEFVNLKNIPLIIYNINKCIKKIIIYDVVSLNFCL